MAAATLNQAVYETWVPAQAALAMLAPGLDERDAAQLIVGRLRVGMVGAAALRALFDSGQPERLAIIPAATWQYASDSHLDLLWSGGDTKIHTPYGDYGMPRTLVAQLYGVRFDPAGLRMMMPSAPPIQQDEPEAIRPDQKLPKVEFEHLELWYAAFKAAYPEASEPLALQSARGMFPGKAVDREWVRSLRGKLQPGRPRKNRDIK